MLNKNQIANLALGRLGTSLYVTDLSTDNSTQAKVIRQHFDMAIEGLLNKYAWKFANKESPLALLSLDPSVQYLYSYTLPSDCQVLREIASDGYFSTVNLLDTQKNKWEIFAGSSPTIYTNVKNAHGKYTSRISNESNMPTHFGEALAAKLSMVIAPSIITNNFPKVKNDLNMEARNDIANCIAEDSSLEPEKNDSPNRFVLSRNW